MRYEAIQGMPLEKFLWILSKENPSCAEVNEYLGEDRAFILALVTKKNKKYKTVIVDDAKAYSDFVTEFWKRIKVWKRWINHKLFTDIRIIANIGKLRRTNHSCCRKLMIVIN